MTKFKLQESLEGQIHEAAKRWKETIDPPMFELGLVVCNRGWLTLEELQAVADWVYPDEKQRITNENSEDDVVVATASALSSSDVCAQWQVLCNLNGVGASTASAVLHWFANGDYPIATGPALWSCSADDVNCKPVPVWLEYTRFCRQMAAAHNIDMRTLDRALCQYGRENRKPRAKG